MRKLNLLKGVPLEWLCQYRDLLSYAVLACSRAQGNGMKEVAVSVPSLDSSHTVYLDAVLFESPIVLVSMPLR